MCCSFTEPIVDDHVSLLACYAVCKTEKLGDQMAVACQAVVRNSEQSSHAAQELPRLRMSLYVGRDRFGEILSSGVPNNGSFSASGVLV